MKNVILLTIIISILALLMIILQGEPVQDKEPHYETRHNYPLGVDRAQYDEIWHDDEEFKEDEFYHEDP